MKWWTKLVSIPHRYGKNNTILCLTMDSRKFPFLIGTVRTFLDVFEKKALWEFPFLIGTVRTFTTLSFYNVQIIVSIPHRYGKNRSRGQCASSEC